MQVIGLVAAIPGLIQIIQKSISIIRVFSDQKSFAKHITDLLDELELVEKILQGILGRLKSSRIHHSSLSQLATVAQKLKDELIALNDLFQPLGVNPPGRKAKILYRARLLTCGFEAKVRKYHERLAEIRSTLTLVIAAQSTAIDQDTLTISQRNLRLKLREVLRPCTYSFIPPNLQGTCDWIASHPTFCEWQLDPANSLPSDHRRRIMCIYGPKGCGKSVLAAAVVEKLKSPNSIAAGFSFWAGSDDQRKLLAFIRTFLWHIIQKVPDDDLSQISVPLLESLPLTERTLEDAISVVLETTKSPFYCIVDGIDESVDDWTHTHAGGLRLILELTKKHANLRVVLLGRDASMRSAASLTALRIEVTEELIRPDINRFILHHLDNSLKVQDISTRQLVRDILQENCNSMFLWVALIFSELSQCQLRSEIIHTLNQLPRDLDREYHRLFVRLQDRFGGTRNAPSLPMKRAKCLLSWIIASLEPLTYEELRCAFAISQCPDTKYEHYMLSQDGILDTCGDFIRVSGGRYHIAHASIIEFLTRPLELWQREDEGIDYFRIDIPQSHIHMLLACTNYFWRVDLGYPLSDASAIMPYLNLSIFICALKFALGYFTIVCISEHDKKSLESIYSFMRTPQFCSLIEGALFILQDGAVTAVAQQAQITDFISWLVMQQSPIEPTVSLLRANMKEELIRRDTVFGQNDDRFRTWKAVVDILFEPLEGNEQLDFGYDLQSKNWMKDETFLDYRIDQLRRVQDVEHGRTAKHTAMLEIGNTVTTRTLDSLPVIKLIRRFHDIIPELLPTPLLILSAMRETNPVRKEQQCLSALRRLTGTNNFLEAYCTELLAEARFAKDGWDKTVEGLLKRSRQITMNLAPSPHVETLHTYTLYYLAMRLLEQKDFSQAQEMVSELQQRFSRGPGEGYTNTRVERKIYRSLLWDDWKATILAYIAKSCSFHRTNATLQVLVLNIVDSNMQLYTNPSRKRTQVSAIAHLAKGSAYYQIWQNDGSSMVSDLARRCEIASQTVLRLTQFPNTAEYVVEQWQALGRLCELYSSQYRHREARKLISQIPADFPTKITHLLSVMNVAATAAYFGDIGIGEVILERASSQIRDQQVSVPSPETKDISRLIAALIRVRPILRLRFHVSVCERHSLPKSISKFSHESDFWGECSWSAYTSLTPCFHELWDIFYIRKIGCAAYDSGNASNVLIYRNFRYNYANTTFDFRCEYLASRYAVSGPFAPVGFPVTFKFLHSTGFLTVASEQQDQKYKAAAIVGRYLVSYTLQKQDNDPFPWSTYYTALSLHYASRYEEALATCRYMLWWSENCTTCHNLDLCYLNIGIACFKIGYDHNEHKNPYAAEFFLLAVASFTKSRDARAKDTRNTSYFSDISDDMSFSSENSGDIPSVTEIISEWLRESRYRLEDLMAYFASRGRTISHQVNDTLKFEDRVTKHQSCPDLRARYLKAGLSPRDAYHLWRKQSTIPVKIVDGQ
ncbi:hypothetical protein RRF57_001676 [Xylaria bambusicola]|uniref:Nephrocystin 3-like N-terminal domain-containing protein n=1 Tax=Xylaria bambusicola TaxID=326684 RepID=A0AAN7U5U9_9PEZI